MHKKFKKYLQENRWENDPTKVYNDLGELAEEIKEYYFTALDALDRLKLGYGEDEEKLQEYVNTIEDNIQKIKDSYMNTPDYNSKDWTVVNKGEYYYQD